MTNKCPHNQPMILLLNYSVKSYIFSFAIEKRDSKNRCDCNVQYCRWFARYIYKIFLRRASYEE